MKEPAASEEPADPVDPVDLVNRVDAKNPPDMGTLSEQERDELFRRCALLGQLADQERVSNASLRGRAQEVGVSYRTLRRYHTRFRRYGLAGLAPRARTDKGKPHNLSPHMNQVVESLRLTHRDAPVRHVYELACQYASATGETPPSLHQVRSICAQIPEPVRLLADGREGEFRNRYRLTYPIRHDPHRIVWQIDHKDPLHVLVRDIRAPSHRRPSGEVRPFLTMVVDSASRLVMAGLFSYDEPNRFTVAAAIRDAMLAGLTNEHKPFGGIPDEIWIDNGKDLVAHHVYQLVEGLGIKLVPGPPHDPEIRGIVERLHRTLDTRLWSTLPGYVGSNVVERNPRAKAELTISQLDEHFQAFIDRYHHEVHEAHRETEQTPLEFWQHNATPIPVDESVLRLLDMLLKEPATRRVHKDGIKYAAERYWHPELSVLVGEDVLVRAAPHYAAPDEIEVFFEGKWRCTAFALRSPQGQTLERQVIVEAQRRQRAHARTRIKAASETLRTVSPFSPFSLTPPAPPASSAPTPKQLMSKRRPAHVLDTVDTLATANALDMPPAAHQPDLFDFLVSQASQAQQTQQTDRNNSKGETR
ncbi:MAG: DDE-type integrase/transposase/recombinase [Chloroflexi bacterium]|nr:DDE-type integrase/transposase/recombinase [Chloroflexota bacterium]